MSRLKSIIAGLATLLTATVIAGAVLPATSSGATDCDIVAAPDGSDGAAGTEADPLRTPGELLDRLRSGETGCLRSGVYTDRQFEVETPSVTLRSYPGERATLRGRLRFEATADGAVAEGMLLDGRNSEDLLGPLIYADAVVIRNNEITNYNSAICVHVDDYPGSPAPRGVVIEGNEIHHCGRLPATNHDHGIYVANARETVIRDNVIYANADRGVQLYPNADDSRITGNVIDGNGQGVIFGGGDSSSSDGNVVSGNVISSSTIRYNVESHWQGPTGRGNVARNNCVWTKRDSYSGTPDGSGIASMSGATAENNVVADPGYANAGSGNYAVKPSSPCADVLNGNPAPAPDDPEAPTDPPKPSKPPKPPKPPKSPRGGTVKAPCATFARGTPGRKLLIGTRGRDHLIGAGGSDRLRGRAGNDRLRAGGGGPDCLIGSGGRDRIRSINGKRDVVRCGRGRDRAVVDRKDRVRGCEKTVVRKAA